MKRKKQTLKPKQMLIIIDLTQHMKQLLRHELPRNVVQQTYHNKVLCLFRHMV